jgi:hypothetical protein
MRLLCLLVLQVQTRRDERISYQSHAWVVCRNANFEGPWVGVRKRRCSDIRYCSVRGLLFHRSFFVCVCTHVFHVCLLHHVVLHKSLHGELPGENDETLVVCGGQEVRQRFNSTPLPPPSHGCSPVPFVLLVSTCEIGSAWLLVLYNLL